MAVVVELISDKRALGDGEVVVEVGVAAYTGPRPSIWTAGVVRLG